MTREKFYEFNEQLSGLQGKECPTQEVRVKREKHAEIGKKIAKIEVRLNNCI